MSLVSPRAVLTRVAAQVPESCRENLVVIGSLAAAYHLFGENAEMAVRTKDLDCIVVPRLEAVPKAAAVADALLAAGWRPRDDGPFPVPGTAATPEEELPVVRLSPPDSGDWFVELLATQDASDPRDRAFERVVLSDSGHYALATFRFLDVAVNRPVPTPGGLLCSRLPLLALSNLLRNPLIGPARTRTPAGPGPRRSNKDLGRVLTIARLAGRAHVEEWPQEWERALREVYPSTWQELARRTGAGLRALLASEGDLREALAVSRTGLLASLPVDASEFRFVAKRLLVDAIEPLEAAARVAGGT